MAQCIDTVSAEESMAGLPPPTSHLEQAKLRRDKRKEQEADAKRRQAYRQLVFTVIREQEGCEARDLTEEEKTRYPQRDDLIWLEGDVAPIDHIIAELQYKDLLEK